MNQRKWYELLKFDLGKINSNVKTVSYIQLESGRGLEFTRKDDTSFYIHISMGSMKIYDFLNHEIYLRQFFENPELPNYLSNNAGTVLETSYNIYDIIDKFLNDKLMFKHLDLYKQPKGL